jgi:hypothetical protein
MARGYLGQLPRPTQPPHRQLRDGSLAGCLGLLSQIPGLGRFSIGVAADVDQDPLRVHAIYQHRWREGRGIGRSPAAAHPAADAGVVSFDAGGADYTHQPSPDGCGEWCTFETLIAEFKLGNDPALARLAKIVHAADVAADIDTDPLGPGLLAIGLGGLDVEAYDQQLLARGTFVYDALYGWCTQHV